MPHDTRAQTKLALKGVGLEALGDFRPQDPWLALRTGVLLLVGAVLLAVLVLLGVLVLLAVLVLLVVLVRFVVLVLRVVGLYHCGGHCGHGLGDSLGDGGIALCAR